MLTLLTALYDALYDVAGGFCAGSISSYWRDRRGLCTDILTRFGVRAWNSKKDSLTNILTLRGFTEEQIKACLFTRDEERELFSTGSVIPIKFKGVIENLMFVSTGNKKLYCKGIPLRHPFNIDAALENSFPIIVTEAPIDAMSVAQLGFYNVISTFGVNFNNLDFSMVADRPLITLFDNDAAGIAGAEKFRLKYPGTKSCFIPKECLMNGKSIKDVNDLVQAGGTPEILRQIIECATERPKAEYIVGRTMAPIEVSSKVMPFAMVVDVASTSIPPETKISTIVSVAASGEIVVETAPPTLAETALVAVPQKARAKYDFYRDCNDLFWEVDEDGNVKKLHPITYQIVQRFYEYFIAKGGQFIYDKNRGFATLFLDDGSVCLDLKNKAARSWLLDQIQIISIASGRGAEVIETLDDFLYNADRSTIVESVCFSTYDRTNKAAYFYTGADSILRISAGEVKSLRNGLNEYGIGLIGPTFPFNDWKYDPAVSKTAAAQLLFDQYVKSLALDEIDALMSLAVNLTHLSPDLSIRASRENTGAGSSGKSEEAKLWGTIIYGKPILGCFKSEDEAWIAVSSNPYTVLDNIEDASVNKYFMLLTSGVTKGTAQKRKHYSDNQLLTYMMNGQLTLTSIRGNSYSEVIQRTISFIFDKRHHRSDYSYQKVLAALQEMRPVILSGTFKMYADDVFPYIEDENNIADQFLRSVKHSRPRLNPFLRETLLWLAALAKYLGKDWETIARTFFARSTEQYNADVADSDLVMQCLTDLKETLKEPGGMRGRQTKITTIGSVLKIEGTAAAFFHDFLQVNKSRTERIFRNPRVLGQRFGNIDPEAIRTIGWIISIDRSNRSGGNYYTFSYDLTNDASSGIYTNVEKLMEDLKEKFEKEGKKVVKLDKPVRTEREILSIIAGGKVAAIEVPSLRFFGSFAHTVADILEGSKVVIIIDSRNCRTDDPPRPKNGFDESFVDGNFEFPSDTHTEKQEDAPGDANHALPESTPPAPKNVPAELPADPFFTFPEVTGAETPDDQSDDPVKD